MPDAFQMTPYKSQDFSLSLTNKIVRILTLDSHSTLGNESKSQKVHIQIQNMPNEVKCFKLSLSKSIYILGVTCFLFPSLNTNAAVFHHVVFGCHFKNSVIQLRGVFYCESFRSDAFLKARETISL